MPENISRSRGLPENYRLDRGGVPTEPGPFSGVVMNNVDPTRSGRLQVYIEAFSDGDMSDSSRWVTVSYLSPFFGSTPPPAASGSNSDVGKYPGNQCSYGMWFTPPDLGITVMCFFVNGDRRLGYYVGVIPDSGQGHMVPAIGATDQYKITNANQEAYMGSAERLPVTELNINNIKDFNDPQFYNKTKPVQSYVAGAMFQQGLIKDPERGPIQSSSQRETPSAVFGVSTPGTAIYEGGLKPNDIRQKIQSGSVRPDEVRVIGRVGGHSLVMDDGDLEGNNALLRLRSSKGHQITLNDTGNFLYIIHANGQAWIELGQEGTLDVYATNSINLRTNGDINLHADRDINMFAGRDVSIKSNAATHVEAVTTLTMTSQQAMTIYSKSTIGVKADGTLTLNSAGGSWGGGDSLVFKAGGIDLNGPAAGTVKTPNPITKTKLDDTKFTNSEGWIKDVGALESIVSRAPTHEPYPYHNLGVDVEISFGSGDPSPPPGSEPVPAGVELVAR
jgi:uncharacterized protein (DUF2345 family)